MADRSTPHYLVVNRFDDECGAYHDYAAGLDLRLSFITLPAGLAVIDPARALEVLVVDDLRLPTVLTAARELIRRHGEFSGIVGISEKDVLMAAALREELGVPGWPLELVIRFKDKVVMKSAVEQAGLRVPRFLPLAGVAGSSGAPGWAESTAAALIERLGSPVVLKPLAEAASRGVLVPPTEAALAEALGRVDLANYEAEEFVPGPVLHVDGVLRDGATLHVSAACYLGTCLDYAHGAVIGSVLLDPGPERDRVIGFTLRCLGALGLRHGPFHLEIIEAPDGELVFLEVGMRPGGGDIPFVIRDQVGVDLFSETFRCSLGLPAAADGRPRSAQGAGFVNFPEPRPLPCRVVARNSLLGKVDGVYLELLPEPGEVFSGSGGYDRVGGRFRIRGRDQAELRRIADEVVDAYQLVVEAVS